MTWRELKQYIEQQDETLLDSEIQIYDFADGSEYDADVTELLFGDDDEEEVGWIPYMTINHKDAKNENAESKTKETSID